MLEGLVTEICRELNCEPENKHVKGTIYLLKHKNLLNFPKKYGLTKRELECLAHIQEFLKSGISPSNRDLMAVMGLNSTSSINRLLNSLLAKGYVDWLPSRARSLRLL